MSGDDARLANGESAILRRHQGRAHRSRAAPQAGKASSRRRGFRLLDVGRALIALDRPHALRPGNRGTRSSLSDPGGTACSEGPLATHPVPAGGIPNRGLLFSSPLAASPPEAPGQAGAQLGVGRVKLVTRLAARGPRGALGFNQNVNAARHWNAAVDADE